MYNNFVKEIDKTIAELKELERVAIYLQEQRDNLISLRKEYKDLLKDFNPTQIAISEVLPLATDILKREALLAVRLTREFDLPIFRSRLEKAIEDPRTIAMKPYGNGLHIDIRLDLTAGRKEKYAEAISAAREFLNIGWVTRIDPEMGSHMWEEKYYKPAREGGQIPQKASFPKRKGDKKRAKDRTAKYIQDYWNTIRIRVMLFGSLAPFWQILDEGSAGQNLSSDEGGSPYPDYGPTNFVQKTKDELKTIYKEQISKYKNTKKELESAITDIDSAIIYIDKLMNELLSSKEKITLSQMKKNLGERANVVDQQRLLQIAQGIAEGKITGGKQARVELGRSPEGKRIQLRIKRILKMLEGIKR